MSLITLSVSSYRCFASEQTIDLRPITCLFGRNNSGKSALARAPLVVSTGVRTDSPTPLDLDSVGDDIVGTFLELIHGNRPHGSLEIGMTFDDSLPAPLRVSIKIQNIDEYHTQVVSELELESGDDRFSMIWQGGDLNSGPAEYSVSGTGFELHGVQITFRGLLPEVIDPKNFLDAAHEELTKAFDAIRKSFDSIRYLGPFRDRPSRFYRMPSRMPRNVGQSGENTAGILATDLVRNQGGLISFINEHFGSSLPGWSINTVEAGGLYNIVLQSKSDAGLRVNLTDTGTGIAQALPIFVQRALDLYRPEGHPVLEIVEQPELHLHPAAHGAIADLYLAAAKDTKTRFVIETHSETFLLRLRRRIAEGEVDPKDVAIYFVDSTGGRSHARRINVDRSGNLDYWPEGVFSEDYYEARQLTRAQLAHLGENDAN
ncbi:DUF3696 domain-containing protein [Amycolatopsis sp. NBC_00345]|uniref:DUF3696 domain-containing protein n=1 Tax=Amycolatopsis sp. NBC_00345 TaxID=2975955 RepID=UPI002E25CA3B